MVNIRYGDGSCKTTKIRNEDFMPSDSETNYVNQKVLFMIWALALLAIVALLLSWRVASQEEEKAYLIWQNNMSVILNGRADVISDWVKRESEAIEKLSENTTLKLFMSNRSGNLGLNNQGEGALSEYIIPLLNDRANQLSYIPSLNDQQIEISANVKRNKIAGLGIIDLDGTILLSTEGLPPVTNALTAYIEKGASKDALLVGPYVGENNLSTVAFITPIFPIDEDENSAALGFLVGIKVLSSEFFNLVQQPGEMSQSAINRIIYEEAGLLHFAQRASSSSPDYSPSIDPSFLTRDISFAWLNPGKFSVTKDEKGNDVLVSSIIIADTDWKLMRSIGLSESMGPAQERKRNILIFSILTILSLGGIIALIWRHGVSIKVQEALKKEQVLAEKYQKLSSFLSIVTDSQPTEITTVDKDGKYTFVNKQAAKAANSIAEEMIGKTPTAVIGKAKAKVDELNIEEVLELQKMQYQMRYYGEGDQLEAFKTDYIPLSGGDVDRDGVLIVKEDLSELERNRIKRELNLKSLVSTLTMIIGSRDPFSRAHSERVVTVTKVLCKELSLKETEAITAELAGAMMNLGKILVPRAILTKPDKLNEDELKIIRDSVLKSADMVEGIEFDGPVSDVLRQVQAHWDGSGEPVGLSGEDILLPARIVAVANAFVGMTSARAYRNGLDMKHAITTLMDEVDNVYDRRPVVALMNYLENKGGFEEWQHFGRTT